jgi:hypothetical protein
MQVLAMIAAHAIAASEKCAWRCQALCCRANMLSCVIGWLRLSVLIQKPRTAATQVWTLAAAVRPAIIAHGSHAASAASSNSTTLSMRMRRRQAARPLATTGAFSPAQAARTRPLASALCVATRRG